MPKNLKSLAEYITPEYKYGRQRWEQKRDSLRYLNIWRKFKKTGKCNIPEQKLFKSFGIKFPVDPKSSYPMPEQVFCRISRLQKCQINLRDDIA